METQVDLTAALQWHIDAGCDECIDDAPINRFELIDVAPTMAAPQQTQAQPTVTSSASGSPGVSRGTKVDPRDVDNNQQVRSAMMLSAQAKSIDELRQALDSFEGCILKKTATNLVLSDGPENAKLMLVGEAPGAEEDRQGLPFVGPSGQLMNAVLGSVGIAREEVMFSNTVFWRPPGNRTPTAQEAAVCKPFIERLIEIVDPKILICVGAPSAHTLLGETQGISRLRGKWFSFQTPNLSHPIDAIALFHPAYLLRTPIKKRDVWNDIRMIKRKLDEHITS